MIIIFEGPDGSGKTTLMGKAHDWGLRHGMTVLTTHHGLYTGIKNPSIKYLASLRRREHISQKTLVLLDRSWLSEGVYGPIMRETDRLGVSCRRMLERVALKCGTLLINCLPPYAVALDNWAKRHAVEYVKKDKVYCEVYQAYQRLRTDLPMINYDFTQEEFDFDEQLDYLREYKPPNHGIGLWHSERTLLIGDQVSKHGLPDLPFVSFHHGGCSSWLAEQLESWKVGEDQLYWVNSYQLSPDFMGRPDAPRNVVALGAKAADWCWKAGLAFDPISHPQYHKRFHSNEPYALQRILT